MLDLYRLDREIADAASALSSAQAALRAHGEADDPLSTRRRVSSKSVWAELGERSDPIAAAARDWVGWLTLERVLWPDRALEAASWFVPRVESEELLERATSARTVRDAVLSENEPGRRSAWGRALVEHTGHIGDAARRLAERRVEAARLLDADFIERLELPADPSSALGEAADALLSRTDTMVERADDWTHAVATALARDASEGWPARLSTRWMAEVFHGTGLTDGLPIDLGALPAPLGATSFARALGRFGAVLAEADVPPSASFLLWRAPVDLRRERRAALFASLPSDPAFARRVLGLGPSAARDQARRVARATLLAIRLDGARTLLRGVLVEPIPEQSARLEGSTERALGAAIPGSLCGVVPQLSPSDAGRLAGVLLAATDRRSLIDRFDEDWFKNPRAARALREEHGTVPARRATAEELETGLDELVEALTGVL